LQGAFAEFLTHYLTSEDLDLDEIEDSAFIEGLASVVGPLDPINRKLSRMKSVADESDFEGVASDSRSRPKPARAMSTSSITVRYD